MSQPHPMPGSATPTWQLVVADMHARDAMGAAKYGVRHQADNGRDHLQDAYEEALDLAVYLRAEIERRKAPARVRGWCFVCAMVTECEHLDREFGPHREHLSR